MNRKTKLIDTHIDSLFISLVIIPIIIKPICIGTYNNPLLNLSLESPRLLKMLVQLEDVIWNHIDKLNALIQGTDACHLCPNKMYTISYAEKKQ